MTFNAAVPASSDSPGIFPSQNQTNMVRLQTILGADHQFNLSAAADDGYHNVVHLTQQAPSGPLAAIGRLYAKSVAGFINLFYMNDAGVEYQITPTLPVYAAVNFIGTTIDGSNHAALRYSYNVANVTYNGGSTYTINFINPIPSNNYIVSGMCFSKDLARQAVVQIAQNSSYSAVVKTTSVQITTYLDGAQTKLNGVFIQVVGST